MTVTSTNYSSIEEVWGDTFNASQKKREKKKKVIDPICELYEMGNNSGYSENDLITYANEYYEKYDKSKYQKNINDDHRSPSEYRERPERKVVIKEDKNVYDVTEKDDAPYYYTSRQTKPIVEKRTENVKPKFVNEDYEEANGNSFAVIDLILYIISGIILIFVMEQFVKIGLLLQV